MSPEAARTSPASPGETSPSSVAEIELDLEMEAKPLLRLYWTDGAVQSWIDQRKQYLEDSLIPERPRHVPLDMTRMFMDATDFNGDRAKFSARLAEHFRKCRDQLLDSSLATICENNINTVVFPVTNPTDDPVVNVRVAASFFAGDAWVLSSVPHVRPMPRPPAWPSPMDDHFGRFGNIRPEEMMSTHPPFPASRMSPAKIRNRDGFVEVEYLLGDLRPHQPTETPPVFVIPGAGSPELEGLDITLTAHAMNSAWCRSLTAGPKRASQPSIVRLLDLAIRPARRAYRVAQP
jgi:hypothetical protein